jgi:hypothetical protein
MTESAHTASWRMLGGAQAGGYVTYLQDMTLEVVAKPWISVKRAISRVN